MLKINDTLRPVWIRAGFGAVPLLLLAGVAGAQNTNKVERLPKERMERAEQPAALLDPFVYHAKGDGNNTFVPAPDADMPYNIKILASMEVEDGKSWAVLSLGQESESVFVTEKSVVYVAPKSSTQNEEATPKGSDPVYLMIHSIKGDTVEISPHKRPQDIHVFQ